LCRLPSKKGNTMETRTITQVRVYKLILNPMTANAEAGELVAASTDYQKLVDWYNSQKAPEPWRDGQWNKVFAEGSPLEWHNPADNLELNAPDIFNHGIRDEWVAESVYIDVINSGRLLIIE